MSLHRACCCMVLPECGGDPFPSAIDVTWSITSCAGSCDTGGGGSADGSCEMISVSNVAGTFGFTAHSVIDATPPNAQVRYIGPTIVVVIDGYFNPAPVGVSQVCTDCTDDGGCDLCTNTATYRIYFDLFCSSGVVRGVFHRERESSVPGFDSAACQEAPPSLTHSGLAPAEGVTGTLNPGGGCAPSLPLGVCGIRSVRGGTFSWVTA